VPPPPPVTRPTSMVDKALARLRRATSLFTERRSGLTSVDQERRVRALHVLGVVLALVLLPAIGYRLAVHHTIYVGAVPAAVATDAAVAPGLTVTGLMASVTCEALDVQRRLSTAAGLIVMSMNVQQGHKTDGKFNGDILAEMIRQSNASLVGLQESDSVHLFTGNVDIVRPFQHTQIVGHARACADAPLCAPSRSVARPDSCST
jgi:hypothetical protein